MIKWGVEHAPYVFVYNYPLFYLVDYGTNLRKVIQVLRSFFFF